MDAVSAVGVDRIVVDEVVVAPDDDPKVHVLLDPIIKDTILVAARLGQSLRPCCG